MGGADLAAEARASGGAERGKEGEQLGRSGAGFAQHEAREQQNQKGRGAGRQAHQRGDQQRVLVQAPQQPEEGQVGGRVEEALRAGRRDVAASVGQQRQRVVEVVVQEVPVAVHAERHRRGGAGGEEQGEQRGVGDRQALRQAEQSGLRRIQRGADPCGTLCGVRPLLLATPHGRAALQRSPPGAKARGRPSRAAAMPFSRRRTASSSSDTTEPRERHLAAHHDRGAVGEAAGELKMLLDQQIASVSGSLPPGSPRKQAVALRSRHTEKTIVIGFAALQHDMESWVWGGTNRRT